MPNLIKIHLRGGDSTTRLHIDVRERCGAIICVPQALLHYNVTRADFKEKCASAVVLLYASPKLFCIIMGLEPISEKIREAKVILYTGSQAPRYKIQK